MAQRSTSAAARTAMLDAARGLIAELGYSELSHSDITAAVGIGRTTFYEHFTSKEDLLVALVQRDLPPMTEDIRQAVDSELPPDERLAELAYHMVRFVGTDHLGLILHTEVPRLSPDAQQAIQVAHESLASEFAIVYRKGVASGVFREMPPRLAGRMMEQIIMTGGKVVMESADPSREVDTIAHHTALLLVAAMRPEAVR